MGEKYYYPNMWVGPWVKIILLSQYAGEKYYYYPNMRVGPWVKNIIIFL
jgi:hypothetical protein